MIYYGDEAGMWGADDPSERKPMVWQDLTYEDERSHSVLGKSRTSDEVKFDNSLHEF
jgi:glycosidase